MTWHAACVCLCLLSGLAGQKGVGQGSFTEDKVQDGPASMTYHFFRPEGTQDGRRYPLVFALHGNGQAAKGHVRGIAKISTREQPSFVVAPQYQSETKFGAAVIQGAGAMFEILLAKLLETEPIDTSRIVLQGFSMGSNYSTTWLNSRLAKDQPIPFRAVWLNGTAVPTRKAIPHVPFLLFVGEKETAVLGRINVVANVRAAYARMFDQGMEVWYLEIPKMGHAVNAACHEIMRWHLAGFPDHSAVWSEKKFTGLPPEWRTDCEHGRFAKVLGAIESVLARDDNKAKAKARALRAAVTNHVRNLCTAQIRNRAPTVADYEELVRMAEDLKADRNLARSLEAARSKLAKKKPLAAEIATRDAFTKARGLDSNEERRAAIQALADGQSQNTLYGRRARAHLQALGDKYMFPFEEMGSPANRK